MEFRIFVLPLNCGCCIPPSSHINRVLPQSYHKSITVQAPSPTESSLNPVIMADKLTRIAIVSDDKVSLA